MHAIRADESNTELLGKSTHCISHGTAVWLFIDIIKQRPKSPTLKQRALSYMENDTKSFEYTLEVLQALQARIDKELKALGGNTKLEKLLEKLRVK